ncbi:MAG: glycine cleavage system protein T [Deltaproteobacteria bacterium]|nr:glycine cleavage system protein T [Deltaproteobacteria bacterium]
MSSTLRTPLYARHVELGAKMMEFAGFSMPVHYSSIKIEHAAVRECAGVFDVSHMGQISIQGPQSVPFLESLLTCHISTLEPGQVRYGLMCNEDGGCVDDVTVYRRAEHDFFLCVNAANLQSGLGWILEHRPQGCTVHDESSSTGLVALQGPHSARILDQLIATNDSVKPSALKRFRFSTWSWEQTSLCVSRTGYTGSDGFEIYIDSSATPNFFDALMETGAPLGLVPAGLGARDTLRIEAALPLYGHELDSETSPLDAGLEKFIKRKDGGFLGHEAMERRATDPARPHLIGFELIDRGVARAGYPIYSEEKVIGHVTSGTPSPTLGKSIGLGFVPHDQAKEGLVFSIDVRGRKIAAQRTKIPFVVKPK